jgi:hypothetical protein
LTWRWNDTRTAKLLPAGRQSETFDADFARDHLWDPDVGICNRALKGVDTISTAFVVKESGEVTKVERVLAIVKNTFAVQDFPFDYQVLRVRVASATRMLDELQLSPIEGPEYSGVKDGIFDSSDFTLVSADVHAFDEIESTLQKSRGELVIELRRQPLGYINSLLLPELLILCISYSVFWFPLTAPFAMPRVATALIAFLSLMTLSLRTNALLPVRAGLSWMDLVENSALYLMFFTVCLNILVLAGYHSFEEKDISTVINKEFRLAFPVLAGMIIGICAATLVFGHFGLVCFIIQSIQGLFAVVYLSWCLLRLSSGDQDASIREHVTSRLPDLSPKLRPSSS